MNTLNGGSSRSSGYGNQGGQGPLNGLPVVGYATSGSNRPHASNSGLGDLGGGRMMGNSMSLGNSQFESSGFPSGSSIGSSSGGGMGGLGTGLGSLGSGGPGVTGAGIRYNNSSGFGHQQSVGGLSSSQLRGGGALGGLGRLNGLGGLDGGEHDSSFAMEKEDFPALPGSQSLSQRQRIGAGGPVGAGGIDMNGSSSAFGAFGGLGGSTSGSGATSGRAGGNGLGGLGGLSDVGSVGSSSLSENQQIAHQQQQHQLQQQQLQQQQQHQRGLGQLNQEYSHSPVGGSALLGNIGATGGDGQGSSAAGSAGATNSAHSSSVSLTRSSLDSSQRENPTGAATASSGAGGGAGGAGMGVGSRTSSKVGAAGDGGDDKDWKYSLAALVDLINKVDKDASTLALGTDLTTFGLNLNSAENLFPTFSSPFSDQVAPPEPLFTTPSCYMMHPPTLKSEHLAKFQIETLFYMFFCMPRDILQACAGQELYQRDWRYHGELKIWLKPRGPQELMQSHPSVQFVYFDVAAWETRLFTNSTVAAQKAASANITNITAGLLSEEDVRVKAPQPPSSGATGAVGSGGGGGGLQSGGSSVSGT